MILFVDLDGTYIRSNSFHRWMRFLAFDRQSGLAPSRRVFVVMLAALRAARTISHETLKRAVLRTVEWQDAAGATAGIDRFITLLAGDIAAPVSALVEQARAGGAHVVLATAAPANYAIPFASRHGFDACLATPSSTKTGWAELLGAHKADACIAYRRGLGLGIEQTKTITDHLDDLPLMSQSATIIWCGQPEQLETVRQALHGGQMVQRIDTVTGAASPLQAATNP